MVGEVHVAGADERGPVGERDFLRDTRSSLRHSGISWALAAGIPASDVARFAGTSVPMLETRYHHLLVSSLDTARARLDAFSQGLGQELATN